MAPPVVRTRAAGALLTPDDRADDGDLAGRIAAGDARAFERLYDRHRAEISRYCATLVRNPQDAEEAFQLTMLAAYRALSAGRGPRAALRPWLFRIAHNECVDLLRNRPPVEELTDRHPVAGLLQERVEARETLRQLSDDIAALPLRQRAAFVLHRIEGLPHAAVGEALGTTPLGARQLLHEARTTLDEFHAGRALACDDVRVRIGAGDRRTLRARGISAHLRVCASCRDARAALQAPRRRRGLLAAAAAVLVAGMVAIGVQAFAAPSAADGPASAPVPLAGTPAPLTPPALGAGPVLLAPAAPPVAAPDAAAPAAPAPAAADPAPAPAGPRQGAPQPAAPALQSVPAPPPGAAPQPSAAPAAPAADGPAVVTDPATGDPLGLATASPEAAPPPHNKPGPGTPSAPTEPTPAPEPAGELAPPEPTPAPEPAAREAAPPANDQPAEAAEPEAPPAAEAPAS